MLLHKKCDSPVFIDIKDNINFIVTFGFSNTGLTIGNADFSFRRDLFPTIFICKTCDETVEIKDLYGICMNCGHKHSIDELFRPHHSGGYYCEKCIKIFDENGEVVTSLEKICQKITTRR